jgi:hypothetical protein
MKKFSFYSRTDSSQESIGITLAFSRLSAAKYFADRKQLPLKSFLSLFKVSK